MASIHKRRYWVDAAGNKVRKGTPGAVERTSKYYTIVYVDGAGRPRRKRGYTERRPTEQLAAKIEKAVAHGEEDLLNRYQKHNQRPLSAHFADYLKDLQILGRDDEYVYIMQKRLERVSRECSWQTLRDITCDAFQTWRSNLHGVTGQSGKTLNQYYDSWRSFLNWCAKKEQDRIPRNPLAGLRHLPHTPTFVRKALQPEDLEKLWDSASLDHWRVYLFAVSTGLRRQEIEDLQWQDAVLDAPVPFLKLRDYATKARRADVFALRSEVAAMLREMRPKTYGATDQVFPGVPSVAELTADLRAAGVEVPADGDLDRIDFHAFRTTLGSFIGRSGIAERVGMELLRVTDPKLLRRTYCDPRVLQTAGAVASLPIPSRRGPEIQEARATGTDAAVVGGGEGGGELARNRPVEVCGMGQPLSSTVIVGDGGKIEQTAGSKGFCLYVSAIGGHCREGIGNAPARTRT